MKPILPASASVFAVLTADWISGWPATVPSDSVAASEFGAENKPKRVEYGIAILCWEVSCGVWQRFPTREEGLFRLTFSYWLHKVFGHLRLAEDENTVFGATLKRFIECTVQSEEADPRVVVRNVRQFINGIKNYLVKHGEGSCSTSHQLGII